MQQLRHHPAALANSVVGHSGRTQPCRVDRHALWMILVLTGSEANAVVRGPKDQDFPAEIVGCAGCEAAYCWLPIAAAAAAAISTMFVPIDSSYKFLRAPVRVFFSVHLSSSNAAVLRDHQMSTACSQPPQPAFVRCSRPHLLHVAAQRNHSCDKARRRCGSTFRNSRRR